MPAGADPKPAPPQGEIVDGFFTMDGIALSGWVRWPSASSPPWRLVCLAAGKVYTDGFSLQPPDAQDVVRFTCDIPLSIFRPPLLLEFDIALTDGGPTGAALACSGRAALLKSIQVGKRDDLLRLVQSFSHRLKEPDLLFYTSLHSLPHFATDFVARAAAIVVMGYRLIEGLAVPPEARAVFDAQIESLFNAQATAGRGHWLRWYTSLKLVAGYLAFREDRRSAAAACFGDVIEFAFDLIHWPSALTNVLIGIFLSGWIYYEDGRFAEAARTWSRAEGVLRAGMSIANLGNYYAYGEVANAIKVAQECYVGQLQANNQGQEVNNVGLLPANQKLDIHHLPGLVFNLGLTKR